MIVTNYLPVQNNVSYGHNVVVRPKSVAKTFSQAPQTAKKAFALTSWLAGLFGAKQVQNAQSQTQTTKFDKNGYREEKVYDKNGRLTNILKYSNADDVLSMSVSYDTQTGKVIQKDWYKKDGLTRQYSEHYDKNENKDQAIYFSYNGTKPRYIEKYKDNNENPREVTYFNRKGNVSQQVYVNDTLGTVTDRFTFNEKGKLSEYTKNSPFTNIPKSTTIYSDDGSKFVKEFDSVTGSLSGQYLYDKENKLIDFKKFDNISAKLESYLYGKDGFDNTLEDGKNTDWNIQNFLQKRFEMEKGE